MTGKMVGGLPRLLRRLAMTTGDAGVCAKETAGNRNRTLPGSQ